MDPVRSGSQGHVGPRGHADAPPSYRGPALHVGVVGHRRLPGADLPRLRATADELFRLIRRRAAAISAGAAPLALGCVSNLAEGADTILSEAALADGWALSAVLPFPCAAYAGDFARTEALARFRALVAAAAGVDAVEGAPRRPHNYLEAARRLLARSDVVIAVWDGLPERGVGGTAQTVREAAEAGRPLILVEARAPHAVRVGGASVAGNLAISLDRWITARRGLPS